MSQPKRIEDVSISDLEAHRWCYYQNDALGLDAFEYVIPDTHPEFSPDTIELELAYFKFANGKEFSGIYDGSESFTLVLDKGCLSFWSGIAKPTQSDLQAAIELLTDHDLVMPVKATSKWSRREKTFSGLEYLNEENEVVSVVI